MLVADLAQATLWEKSRLSHQLRRMSERGLLHRDTVDRRRHSVALTEAGWAVIRAAAPANAERVRESFTDVLATKELDVMQRHCAAVRAAIDEHLAGTGCQS